jgi:D-alanyl-D-alanine carboxypeptidase
MRRIPVVVLVAAAVIGVTAAGLAAVDSYTGPEPDIAVLQRDADALLGLGAPGVLVGVSTPAGEGRVRSGHGDVATRAPVPWDARFRIGSYTKTFVATTALQLVGEGRLALEDSVERWLPGVVSGNGNEGRAITIRQLLQHTSGLPEYLAEMPYLFEETAFEQNRHRGLAPAEAVALALKSPPMFAPGSQWQYSNTNYMLAGMVIEAVTGNDWQGEVRARVVAPLGLADTTLPGSDPAVPAPHAVGYERFPGPGGTPEDQRYGRPLDVTELNPSWGGAAGEMISTTEDGNRFLQALLGGEVLAPEQLAEMQRTVPAPPFEEHFPGARYGLGIMFMPNSCGGYWSHGGDIHGFMTRNGVTPDGSRSVVVSINTDSLDPGPGPDPTLGLVDHALCGTG